VPSSPSRSSRPTAPASYASAASASASAASGVRSSMRAQGAALLFALIAFSLPGCYLGHVAAGQWRLLARRQPIDALLRDPTTPADLRERLALAPEARRLARELGLEVGGQYTSYVAWPGDRVVTAVVATRPGEVEPRGFWFPIVGRVPYKGFFDPERAHAEALDLQREGCDVCEVAVPAYSTLGWLDDPVTQPMLQADPGRIVETIVHELVHATVFVPDAPDWNEGVATFVGQEAAVRWQVEAGRSADAARERARVEDERRLAAALLALRAEVADLYAREPAGPARDAARAAAESRARDAVAALPLSTRDAPELARTLRLNDACLALVGTYSADLPRYAELLASEGGDLATFVGRLRAAAAAPDPRAALLAP
jgi:predicted aminopeptidase